MENRSRRMRLQFFGGSVLCVGCFRRSKDNLSFERKAWIEHECWRGCSKKKGKLFLNAHQTKAPAQQATKHKNFNKLNKTSPNTAGLHIASTKTYRHNLNVC